VAKTNGRPDCAVNPDIHKDATSFGFLPPLCTPGLTCTGIRALVLSITDSNPIEPGSVLYNCKFAIASDEPAGPMPLLCTNAGRQRQRRQRAADDVYRRRDPHRLVPNSHATPTDGVPIPSTPTPTAASR
jgi:hypothetical protein